MKRKICVVVNSRANYGRIKSFLKSVNKNKNLQLDLIVGASGLLYKYGEVIKIIDKAKLPVSKKIYSIVEGGNLVSMVKSTGLTLIELASYFENSKPNFVVVVADRYENMSIAVAASYMNIPLVHVQGGEVSGSIDEKVRHAITKLADIHFVSTSRAKKFVEFMGENKDKVFKTGCPSIDLVNKKNFYLDRNIFLKTGVGGKNIFKKKYIVVLQHSNTNEYFDTKKNIIQTVKAVSKLSGNIGILWMWPNIDAGTDEISKIIRKFYQSHNKKNLYLCRNFPPEIYAKVIKNSLCLVGNSSSAIREGSFLGIPAVNIGTRQINREMSSNVISVGYNQKDIFTAIKKQITHGHYKKNTLYGDGFAGEKMAKILSKINVKTTKKLNYLDES